MRKYINYDISMIGEKIQLLASDGMLIKRPILVSSKGIINGFKKEEWEKLI